MTISSLIQQLKDDGPATISIMVTGQHCNFRCDHCMYDCGPEQPLELFSLAALRKARDMVEILREHEIRVSVNFVGGEPTLDMDHFANALAEVMSWDVDAEMTTNGWWLHKPETTRQFFNAVRRYVDPDGNGLDTQWGRSFTVRVSNDEFHDESRPERLQGNRLRSCLDNLFEGYDEDGVFYKTRLFCAECDDYVDGDPCPNDCSDHDIELDEDSGAYYCWDCEKDVDDPEAHTVNHEIEYDEEEVCQRPPAPNKGDPWIYVEDSDHNGRRFVIPNGRGANIGGNAQGCSKYSNIGKLTFMPDGRLVDICCKGSWVAFGTLDDHPLMLLALAERFMKEAKPSCWDCRFDSAEWAEENLGAAREEIGKDIERLEWQHELAEEV